MPGPQIKNWELYHGLIEKGYSKETAARIANSVVKKRRKRRREAR